MSETLAAILHDYLTEHAWSFEKLATEAGLPRNTVYRWTRGEVRRVRNWQDLVRAARAFRLNRFQTNALLAAGGQPPVHTLLARAATDDDRELLSRWALPPPPHNLPAQLTSFVGRQNEIAHTSRLLASSRLVTLTGPGGVGKTRLAIETALAMQDGFDELVFVDLAEIHEPALILPAISRALSLREMHNDCIQHTLATYLRDTNILLVLDNLEQVIEAAPLLTTLLRAAHRTKMLVTSRRRLHVQGEHTFAIQPLPLPGETSSMNNIARNPAVTLFLDRARAGDSSFTLTFDNAPLIADICARLDGLPLGIELAAASIAQMTPAAMTRISGSLDLARNGPRDAPGRHRSLRATIAWSYDVLTPDEQRVLATLGAIGGSFTEDAAIAMCGARASQALASLVEHSLIRKEADDSDVPHYVMLRTIREFAHERLI